MVCIITYVPHYYILLQCCQCVCHNYMIYYYNYIYSHIGSASLIDIRTILCIGYIQCLVFHVQSLLIPCSIPVLSAAIHYACYVCYIDRCAQYGVQSTADLQGVQQDIALPCSLHPLHLGQDQTSHQCSQQNDSDYHSSH